MKVVIQTLGCKLNQAETESLAGNLVRAGHQLVADLDVADTIIVNTCTVTATADAKSRQLLRQAHRLNPSACVVATGCYAQREQTRLAAMPGIDLVVNNANKGEIASLLDRLPPRTSLPDSNSHAACMPRQPAFRRTRAFVKVQEGCNGACAYCIVPMVRGAEESAPGNRVLAEIQRRESEGFKEIVLTGNEIGAYRSNGQHLTDLVETILQNTRIPRIRLSSLQPQEISSALLSLWRDGRLCPHFHISLQSGCDATLRRMRRRYSVAQYAEAVSLIRSIVPEAAITTDLMVGFPGETEAEFDESYQTCRVLGFARTHVFPYSPRPGTEAASLAAPVAEQKKKDRSNKMLALAGESALRFRRSFAGKSRPVLWENKDADGSWTGFTDNYILLKTRSEDDLTNQLQPFMID